MRSYAKVNFTLEVIKKRLDGYHKINSVIVPINLYDVIKIKKISNDNIIIRCNRIEVPVNELNVVHKILTMFKKSYKIKDGFLVTIIKKIPSHAGLGGGSSDGASVAKWMMAKYNIKNTWLLRKKISYIGADILFFLEDEAAVISGMGDRVKRINFPHNYKFYLIKPKQKIKTNWAYSKIRFSDKGMTKKLLESIHGPTFNSTFLYNQFDQDLKKISLRVFEAKEYLLNCGFKKVMLSGSGSAFICIGKISKSKIWKLKIKYPFVKKVKTI